jgi:putative ABC transport system permease protein
VPQILDWLLVDFRYALKSLRSQLQFSGMVAGILAIAVASVTAVFSIIHLFVLTPGALGNTDRLGWVYGVDLERANDRGLFSIPDFLDIRDRAQSFEMLAARSAKVMVLTGYGQAARVGVLRVTVNHLPVWDITLFRGRPFVEEDVAPGAMPVAILNYHLWQGRFGGDPSLVGRSIVLDGEAVSVIGVLDPKYPTGALGDLWMPLSLEAGRHGPRDNRTVAAVGLLAPGTSLRHAHHEVRAIALQLQREHPSTNAGQEARVVDTWRGWFGPQTDYNLGLLGVGALLVLAIGCVNVALLLLARAIAHEQEVRVRLAVGASRRRLVAQQAIEGLVLAVPGTAGGLGLAVWVVLALKGAGGSGFTRLSIEWAVFGKAALVALVWPLIFTAIPALTISLRGSLRPGEGRRSEASRASRRQQRSLAMVQVASALTLLVVAGVVVRSFAATLVADFGVDQRNLVNVSLTLPAWKYEEPGEFGRFFDAAVERVGALRRGVARGGRERRAGTPGCRNAPARPVGDRWRGRRSRPAVERAARERHAARVRDPRRASRLGTGLHSRRFRYRASGRHHQSQPRPGALRAA